MHKCEWCGEEVRGWRVAMRIVGRVYMLCDACATSVEILRRSVLRAYHEGSE